MKKLIPVLIAVVLILIVGGVYFAQRTVTRYSYSKEREDLDEYFGINSSDDVPVMINNEMSELHARLIDGGCYMKHADVDEWLNAHYYDGEADGVLLYATPTAVISSNIGESTWQSTDGTSGQEDHPITVRDGEDLWILVDFVEHHADFSWQLFTEPNHLRLVTEWTSFKQSKITKKTELRVLGGVKSNVLKELDKGDAVVVLEQMETWSKVRTDDAFIGYVENKRISEPITMEAIAPESKVPVYESIRCEEPVVLAWHTVAGVAGNDTMDALVKAANVGEKNGLNTISPTWFTLSDDQGGIQSFADAAYVSRAHEMGLAVWGLVDNFTGEGDTASVLEHASGRKTLINNLIAEADRVGMDGINVDFEQVPSDSGEDYIEFIRELSIACRASHYVLSVDNYVPMGVLNDHYDRKEQGIYCDYVIVMGYDEHYSGSPEAGSVASIGFVEDGIRRTTAEVPPEKVIGGIPFYTRVWTTKDGSVNSDALSMQAAADWIEQRGVTLSWDDETCQNYGEFTENDGSIRQIWMEDAESLKTKVTVMGTYDIAGVAAWQLGFETPDVWPAIAGAL